MSALSLAMAVSFLFSGIVVHAQEGIRVKSLTETTTSWLKTYNAGYWDSTGQLVEDTSYYTNRDLDMNFSTVTWDRHSGGTGSNWWSHGGWVSWLWDSVFDAYETGSSSHTYTNNQTITSTRYNWLDVGYTWEWQFGEPVITTNAAYNPQPGGTYLKATWSWNEKYNYDEWGPAYHDQGSVTSQTELEYLTGAGLGSKTNVFDLLLVRAHEVSPVATGNAPQTGNAISFQDITLNGQPLNADDQILLRSTTNSVVTNVTPAAGGDISNYLFTITKKNHTVVTLGRS